MEYSLELRRITKEFPGVRALDQVTLRLKPGEIHALVGENGAGKSTLVKVATGVYQPDAGEIFFKGQRVNFKSPWVARHMGIMYVPQEVTLVPRLTVEENICLGREPRKGLFIDRGQLVRAVRSRLDELGISLPERRTCSSLSVAGQQLVAIAEGLYKDFEVLILDEPTSSLSAHEAASLMALLRRMRNQGRSLLFISHRLEEVLELADTITVLKDGQLVRTLPASGVTKDMLVELMTGRKVDSLFPHSEVQPSKETVLIVKALTKAGAFEDISFEVSQGQVLGVYGLVGSGRSELLRALAGATTFDGGHVYLGGRSVRFNNPREALAGGVAYLTEDRKAEGILPELNMQENMSISGLRGFVRVLGFLRLATIKKQVDDFAVGLNIKTTKQRQAIKDMSGGTQQKVILCRYLLINSQVFLLDEPTKGIDVAAKAEIYGLINQLKAQGKAIILVSSELPEVLGLSDVILVMHKGKIVGRFIRGEVSEKEVLECAFGGV